MGFIKYQKVEKDKVEPIKKEAATTSDGEKPTLDQVNKKNS